MRNLKIWLLYTKNAFLQTMGNRVIFAVFMFGKTIRIFLFLVFLHFLLAGSKNLAGYNREQVIFFYLTFNLIDSMAQFFFREVYKFRELVVTGNLDLVLVKPVNPLLRALLGGADLLDGIILILVITATVLFGIFNLNPSFVLWLVYFLLVLNSLLLAAAFHIFVLGMGIISTSVDHLVMVYRDLTALLRVPVDLYREPLRGFLTFVVPLGIMITFPPKALMGLLSLPFIILAFALSFFTFYLSLVFWKYSLKKYQSASS